MARFLVTESRHEVLDAFEKIYRLSPLPVLQRTQPLIPANSRQSPLAHAGQAHGVKAIFDSMKHNLSVSSGVSTVASADTSFGKVSGIATPNDTQNDRRKKDEPDRSVPDNILTTLSTQRSETSVNWNILRGKPSVSHVSSSETGSEDDADQETMQLVNKLIQQLRSHSTVDPLCQDKNSLEDSNATIEDDALFLASAQPKVANFQWRSAEPLPSDNARPFQKISSLQGNVTYEQENVTCEQEKTSLDKGKTSFEHEKSIAKQSNILAKQNEISSLENTLAKQDSILAKQNKTEAKQYNASAIQNKNLGEQGKAVATQKTAKPENALFKQNTLGQQITFLTNCDKNLAKHVKILPEKTITVEEDETFSKHKRTSVTEEHSDSEQLSSTCTDKSMKSKLLKLRSWSLQPVKNQTGVRVEGKLPNTEYFWCSSIITERVNARVLKSLNGSHYHLIGTISKLDTLDAGFSETVVTAFRYGFPVNWKELLDRNYQKCDQQNDTGLEQIIMKGKKEKRQEKPIVYKTSLGRKCTPKQKEKTMNNHSPIWTPRGLISRQMGFSEVRRTQSGRCIIPPLAHWAGQKVHQDTEGNIIISFASQAAEQYFAQIAQEELHTSKRIMSHKDKLPETKEIQSATTRVLCKTGQRKTGDIDANSFQKENIMTDHRKQSSRSSSNKGPRGMADTRMNVNDSKTCTQKGHKVRENFPQSKGAEKKKKIDKQIQNKKKEIQAISVIKSKHHNSTAEDDVCSKKHTILKDHTETRPSSSQIPENVYLNCRRTVNDINSRNVTDKVTFQCERRCAVIVLEKSEEETKSRQKEKITHKAANVPHGIHMALDTTHDICMVPKQSNGSQEKIKQLKEAMEMITSVVDRDRKTENCRVQTRSANKHAVLHMQAHSSKSKRKQVQTAKLSQDKSSVIDRDRKTENCRVQTRSASKHAVLHTQAHSSKSKRKQAQTAKLPQDKPSQNTYIKCKRVLISRDNTSFSDIDNKACLQKSPPSDSSGETPGDQSLDSTKNIVNDLQSKNLKNKRTIEKKQKNYEIKVAAESKVKPEGQESKGKGRCHRKMTEKTMARNLVKDPNRWSEEEMQRFNEALRQISSDNDHYWDSVSCHVRTRTADECAGFFLQDMPSSKSRRKQEQTTKLKHGNEKPTLQARQGTLKRRHELRAVLDHENASVEDDLFESTPFRNSSHSKRLRIDLKKSDEEIFGRNPNFFTPRFDGSHKWSSVLGRTPASSRKTPRTNNTFSPWIDKSNNNMKAVDRYVFRMQKNRRQLAKTFAKKKNVNDLPPSGPSPAQCLFDHQSSGLFKVTEKKTDDVYDSGEEMDYYYSDPENDI